MMQVFELISQKYDALSKEAFIGAAAKMLVTNPLRTIGAVMTGQQLAQDSKKMVGAATTARNMAGLAKPPKTTF